jgi:hypothetical protein
MSIPFPTANMFDNWIAQLALSTICVVLIGGCASKDAPSSDDAQLRAAMTLLGLQYGSYLSEMGAPPPDEPALRKYLQSRLTELSDLGVKSVDDLLRQGRDGQPFKLLYGTKVPVAERPEYVWVAFEQVGLGGMRLACDSRGGVYEVSDLEFSQQLAGK